MTWLTVIETTKDINIFYVLPMFIAEKDTLALLIIANTR
jgi:hypothetical protein